MVKLSERAERKLFAGYLPIDLARNPAMAARRKARQARKHSGYCLPGQRRAYRAKNVFGRVIWANKPRRFGGLRWIEARACMASFVEYSRRCERARDALNARDQALYGWSKRREWHCESLAAAVATIAEPLFCEPVGGMDAPDLLPGGGMRNHLDAGFGVPIVVRRGVGEMSADIHPGIAALAAEQMRKSSYNGPVEWFVPVLWSVKRRGYRARIDDLCMTDAVSLDAPDCIAAGCCRNLLPFWWPGDCAPQVVIRRGDE